MIVADLTEQGLIVNIASSIPEALRILHTSPVPVIAFFDYRVGDETPLTTLPTIEQGGPVLRRLFYIMTVFSPLGISRWSLWGYVKRGKQTS